MGIFRKRRKEEKRKTDFEASMLLDNSDIKIVEARFKDAPFFVGIGTSEQREKKIAGEVSLQKMGGKGEYGMQKELKWRIFINPDALPTGFIPGEKVMEVMKGTISMVSGTATVYETEPKVMEAHPEIWDLISEKGYYAKKKGLRRTIDDYIREYGEGEAYDYYV